MTKEDESNPKNKRKHTEVKKIKQLENYIYTVYSTQVCVCGCVCE